MEYYHNIITEKSFQLLQELRKKYNFILIGGWAVFLYTHTLKSKDIDLIIDYDELTKLREEFSIFKNDRLKKYEIKKEEIDIDIYLAHFSELGFPLEEINNYLIEREGFKIPKPEILMIFKIFAWQNRRGTPRGEKDKIDIISLLKNIKEFDFNFFLKILSDYKLTDFQKKLIEILENTSEVRELELNQHQFNRFKRIIINKLK